MGAMMVSAGPASADVLNTGDFTTQQGIVAVGDDWWWSSDDDWWWSGGGGISFTIGDTENDSGGVSFLS